MKGTPGGRPARNRPVRILFVSTYPPRACGIGTFTRDLTASIRKEIDWITPHIAAIDIGEGEELTYGDEVTCRVMNCRRNAYARLAGTVSSSRYDVACVQHEFGIFSGEWGRDLIDFYLACRKPIVTTLHTVIPRRLDLPRRIIRTIVRKSVATVVMAKIGIDVLRHYYDIESHSIEVIPHGVPSFRRVGAHTAKRVLGLQNRNVISSFGLLSRGKGVEYMIAAMPQMVDSHPNVIYCILGQTHPIVKKTEGESYRQELAHMVHKLGLRHHVRFVDRFLSDDEVSLFLEATDVYVAPYVGADQITSGAMARALFFGKAIVSTPFLYATELLANGRGRLVPFRNSAALGREVAAVLSDENGKAVMEASLRAYARRMSWDAVAHRYATVFEQVVLSTRGQRAVCVSGGMRQPAPVPLSGILTSER